MASLRIEARVLMVLMVLMLLMVLVGLCGLAVATRTWSGSAHVAAAFPIAYLLVELVKNRRASR
jgi:hypothetical protein